MKQAPARLPAFAAAGSKLADTRSTVSPADRGRVSEADREHGSRHCEERKQSILFARPDGLLRFARNDGIAIAAMAALTTSPTLPPPLSPSAPRSPSPYAVAPEKPWSRRRRSKSRRSHWSAA